MCGEQATTHFGQTGIEYDSGNEAFNYYKSTASLDDRTRAWSTASSSATERRSSWATRLARFATRCCAASTGAQATFGPGSCPLGARAA